MSDLIPRVAIIGKDGATLGAALGVGNVPLEEADLALFIVSAVDGIVRTDNDLWAVARELYIPSIVVINDLSGTGEIDFEDMSAIAAKMLDPVVTPYLVLHEDSGEPAALIELSTLKIRDYTTGECVVGESDAEHKELVAEFVEEYVAAVEDAGDGAFENGMIFPAIPFIPKKNIGITEIKNYFPLLNLVPSAS